MSVQSADRKQNSEATVAGEKNRQFLPMSCGALTLITVAALTIGALAPLAQPIDPMGQDLYDVFYNDNSLQTRNYVTSSFVTQAHTFHTSDDEDWWILQVVKGPAPYTIKVTNLGDLCDPRITVYERFEGDQLVLVDEIDNSPEGVGESEEKTLSASAVGRFYILIDNVATFDENPPAGRMAYELKVTRNTADNVGLPTVMPSAAQIGPEGGTLPEAGSTKRGKGSAVAEWDPCPVSCPYGKVLLTVPAHTLSEATWVLLDSPGDMVPPPQLAVTEKWRVGVREDNATIVRIAFLRESEFFDPPLRLRFQMLDDYLLCNWFWIDDIPAGKSIEDAVVWRWDGAQWQVFDCQPRIEGDTAETMLINRLIPNPSNGYVEGYFALSAERSDLPECPVESWPSH